MTLPNLTLLALAVAAMSPASAVAQDRPVAQTEAAAEIAGRLRAFYFNLAHHDWEALTADILAAKVVAHRAMPETWSLTGRQLDLSRPSSGDVVCPAKERISIRQAVITVVGDWAEALVPHCPADNGSDEFRLIRFAGRWRFVGIHLLQQPVSVTAER